MAWRSVLFVISLLTMLRLAALHEDLACGLARCLAFTRIRRKCWLCHISCWCLILLITLSLITRCQNIHAANCPNPDAVILFHNLTSNKSDFRKYIFIFIAYSENSSRTSSSSSYNPVSSTASITCSTKFLDTLIMSLTFRCRFKLLL